MHLLVLVLAACASTTGGHAAPGWFVGAWKREWVRPKGRAPLEGSWVRDLQTPTVFGSVRIPLARPAFPNATSFDDLDDAQLAALVAQSGGFSGTASFDHDVATWRHDVDFQPPDTPDVGRLTRNSPSTVLEDDPDGSYSELWWRMSSGDGRYLGIVVRRAGRVERILTVVGDHFVYARNRAHDLPPAESLAALVASTHATRAQIIEMVDCELSYGLVHGGRLPWEIRHSTLPWREGKSLDFAREVTIDATGSPAPRTPSTDTWTVPVNTIVRDDLLLLFRP